MLCTSVTQCSSLLFCPYVSDMLNTRLSPVFVVLLLDTTDSYDGGRVE